MPKTRVYTQIIGTKKNTFQLELKNRFTALEERYGTDSLNKNMTEMIQQSAMSRAKQTKKQKKPKISSHTSLRALITERRIPKTWKEANNGDIFQEREQKRHQELETRHRDIFNSNLAICLKRQVYIELLCTAS